MTAEIAFFVMSRFTRSKDSPFGRISDSRARPTVVSTTRRTAAISPFSPGTYSVILALTRACSSAARLS